MSKNIEDILEQDRTRKAEDMPSESLPKKRPKLYYTFKKHPKLYSTIAYVVMGAWLISLYGTMNPKGFDFLKIKKNDMKHAIEQVEKNPSSFAAQFRLGLQYFHNEEYEKAIDAYGKGIESNSEFTLAYNYRGQAYFKQGNLEDAIADFNKVIELSPKIYPEVYAYLGLVFLEKGDISTADEYIDKALNYGKHNFDIYSPVGIYYYEKKDYETAEKYFNELLKIESKSVRVKVYHKEAKFYLEQIKENKGSL